MTLPTSWTASPKSCATARQSSWNAAPDAASRRTMTSVDPELCRSWLFGPGADGAAHAAMLDSGADALIVDLEDFTPPARRDEARRNVAMLLERWREAGRVAAVRINALDTDGPTDLAAAMAGHPHVVAYPMAASAEQMR